MCFPGCVECVLLVPAVLYALRSFVWLYVECVLLVENVFSWLCRMCSPGTCCSVYAKILCLVVCPPVCLSVPVLFPSIALPFPSDPAPTPCVPPSLASCLLSLYLSPLSLCLSPLPLCLSPRPLRPSLSQGGAFKTGQRSKQLIGCRFKDNCPMRLRFGHTMLETKEMNFVGGVGPEK